MGIGGLSITLANGVIGVGILAMPYCFQQCGALLATLMLLISGLVSRLSCHFLLKSSIIARRRNFEYLALHVFGASGKLFVEICIIGFLMGTCIAYFVVVGDLGPQIISKMFNINQSDVLRTSVMIIVSLVCVLPLGLLKNVDSLSNVSAATIAFYVCLIMKIVAEAGMKVFTEDWWSRFELWKPEGVLQCVPIFSMALFCQTQLFEVFEVLPTISLEKMNMVTKNALNICTVVYMLVGLFGYMAFGSHTISGNVLVSLSPTMASDVIKLGFVMSIAFSFPLIIFPCRASLYSLLYRRAHSTQYDMLSRSMPELSFKCITIAIISVSLIFSLLLPNIELVLGLLGSTIGVVICVIFPAACFILVTHKNTNERILSKVVLCLGIIVMVLGTYANLRVAESKLENQDNTQDLIDKMVEQFAHEQNAILKMKEVEMISKKDKIKEDKERVVTEEPKLLIVESEVQPPNPVAPVKPLENKIKDKANIDLDIEKKEEESNYEGAGDKEIPSNEEKQNKTSKIDKIIKEAEKLDKPVVNQHMLDQNKINLLKQQALVETIKQHRDEQKELIEEQKQILHELKEIKNDIDNNDVKDKNTNNAIEKKVKEQIDKAEDAETKENVKLEMTKVETNQQQSGKIPPNIQNKQEEVAPKIILEKVPPSEIMSKMPIVMALNQKASEITDEAKIELNKVVLKKDSDTDIENLKREKRSIDMDNLKSNHDGECNAVKTDEEITKHQDVNKLNVNLDKVDLGNELSQNVLIYHSRSLKDHQNG